MDSSGNLRHRRKSEAQGTSSGTVPVPSSSESLQQPVKQQKSLLISWRAAFVFLLISRSISAAVNIIHDCDETFNYWEPLHYLLHESGFQTWEYSSAFALRSYLYLFLHALVALPVTLFFGNGSGWPPHPRFLPSPSSLSSRSLPSPSQVNVCLALPVLSAASEASLLVAIATAIHKATQAPSLPSLLPVTSFPTFPTSFHAFYAVRLALEVLSAASEASLPVAVAAALHKTTQTSPAPFPSLLCTLPHRRLTPSTLSAWPWLFSLLPQRHLYS
ncbi:unnamed protein product [Closterium sp. Yama58-4]|nr:unnamed protein product [Closterium sp. Yama58-4]